MMIGQVRKLSISIRAPDVVFCFGQNSICRVGRCEYINVYWK
jgi:hypothetical protein